MWISWTHYITWILCLRSIRKTTVAAMNRAELNITMLPSLIGYILLFQMAIDKFVKKTENGLILFWSHQVDKPRQSQNNLFSCSAKYVIKGVEQFSFSINAAISQVMEPVLLKKLILMFGKSAFSSVPGWSTKIFGIWCLATW